MTTQPTPARKEKDLRQRPLVFGRTETPHGAQLAELILIPYLGREKAAEVARRPRPDSPSR